VAFSRPERRKLHQGAIRYANRLWTTYQGDHVTLLVPQYEEHGRLAVRDDRDRFLCFVEPDTPFGFLDSRGAQESARRDRLQRQAQRDLDRSAPDLNLLEECSAVSRHCRRRLVRQSSPRLVRRMISVNWLQACAKQRSSVPVPNLDVAVAGPGRSPRLIEARGKGAGAGLFAPIRHSWLRIHAAIC
jgi:hypothetical protein